MAEEFSMGPPKVHSEEASSLIRQLLTPDLDMRLKSAVEVKVRSESPSQGHLWVTRDFQLLNGAFLNGISPGETL